MPADVLEAASGSMIGWSRPRLGVNYDLHSEQCSSPGQSNWPVFPRVEKRPTSNPPYLRNGLTYPPHSVLSLSLSLSLLSNNPRTWTENCSGLSSCVFPEAEYISLVEQLFADYCCETRSFILRLCICEWYISMCPCG